MAFLTIDEFAKELKNIPEDWTHADLYELMKDNPRIPPDFLEKLAQNTLVARYTPVRSTK